MLTGPEKAVIFLLSLDEKTALPIVSELSEAELRKLRSVATTMREVDAGAIDETYREFVDRSGKAVAVPRGGLPYLKRLTAGALGDDVVRNVFEDRPMQSPLSRIEAASSHVVGSLLAKEPPQLAAAILVRLDPKMAAEVLAAMPEERQAAVVQRVSKMTELPAGILEEVAGALAAELPSSDGSTSVGVDGMARVAEILNASGKEAVATILSTIEEGQPDLSREIRLAMFTFDDLTRLEARAMRILLREVPSDRLTLALKGAPEPVMNAVFGGLSSRAVEVIRDELELLGNPRKADIEKARTEIIETALRLEAEGTLDLGRNG